MTHPPYRATHVSELPAPAGVAGAGEAAWRAVRSHFDIRSFGISAYVAETAGDVLTSEHDEIEDSGTRHEELFYVASGHAAFTVDGETVDAPAGTFLYVRDPAVTRGATARDAGTVVLAVGGEPGKAFEISPWEKEYGSDS